MKNTYKGFIAVIVVLGTLLFGCEEKRTPQPEPTPAPTPLSTPTPKPQATPTPLSIATPTPAPRLAPDGILYVQEEISITTEYGIRRLSAGKEVHIVREEGDMVTVKDGEFEVSAPMSNFTRDMDVRDELAAKRDQVQKIAVQTSLQKKAQFEAEQAALQRIEVATVSKQAKTQTAEQITSLKTAISEWDARISKAQRERAEKGYPRSGGKSYSGSRDRATSLSADASQIDALIATRDKLWAQLRQLESHH